MSYSVRSKNPFEDDDDSRYKFGNRNRNDEPEDIRMIQEKIGRVEDASLESSRRALQMLNETNEIGVRTASELVVQGEKLNNINERLDEVNNTLTSTQKNINQIKSVFGGIKNKFFSWGSGNNKTQTESVKKEEKINFNTSASANSLKSFNQPKADFVQITGSDREQELNKNLDDMSSGLRNLANLGLQMQFELDKQNKIIGNITDKVGNTDTRIQDQNAQMKKILK